MTGRTVWLASYPKSGNTWLRAVYTALRRGTTPDINALDGGDSTSSRELFDSVLGTRSSDLTPDEVDLLRPRADDEVAVGTTVDIWRKTHDALFAGPNGKPIVSIQATSAALYIVRDPRDVAVSFAHYADLPLALVVDSLCSSSAVLSPGAGCLLPLLSQRLGSWSEHVRSWVDEAPFPVHTLRYEDCITDPVPTFREAFAAAGLVASNDEVAQAVARSSLDRLKAQEEQVGFCERLNGRNAFFRRGVAGGWADELPAGLARQIEEQHREVMGRFGYLAVSVNGKGSQSSAPR